jgi:hypothetical protein
LPAIDLKNELNVAEEADVALLRGMTIQSMRTERARGMGPPYQKMGRKVFYPIPALRKFLAASTITPKRASTLIDGSSPRRKATGR